SPSRNRGRKNGSPNKLSPLPPTLGDITGGAQGGIGRPKKPFQKRDLVEAVRKLGNLSTTNSKIHLGAWAGGSDMGIKNRKARDDNEIGGQLRVMETGVNSTSRRFNELKLKGDRKALELQRHLDTLHMLKIENDALERMKRHETPESARIKDLTREIVNDSKEIEAKLHYRRILNHMYQRLDSNQVKFDAHLNGMEEALKATRKEKNDVEAMTRQLETGRTKAMLDLQETQRLVAIDRRERSRVLSAKEKEAEMARKMGHCREQRELMRIHMTQTLRGDLTGEQEVELMQLLEAKECATNQLRAENEIRQKKLADMEEMFSRVRQATGVSTLEEMVIKFANQNTNHTTLEEEKQDAETKLAKAKLARSNEEERFSYMKASGVGNTELNREISDKLKTEIQEARVEAKMKKVNHQRLQDTLVGVKQGAVGLCQRLEPYSYLLDGEDSLRMESMREESSTGAEVEGDTVEALGLSETLLSMMLEVISTAHDGGASRYSLTVADQDDSSDSVDSTCNNFDNSNISLDEMPSKRNNVRVRSTAQLRSAEQPPQSVDDVESERGTQPSVMESDDDQAVEDMVPNRAFLKLCSSRQHTETVRKIESNKRKKKLAERMEAADETEKATLTSKLARKKQQDEAMERISTPAPAVGLPKGITQRERVYALTEAFLTHVPNLA
ncbi:unnamed protein product, partial [Choristocarpus tenellus]